MVAKGLAEEYRDLGTPMLFQYHRPLTWNSQPSWLSIKSGLGPLSTVWNQPRPCPMPPPPEKEGKKQTLRGNELLSYPECDRVRPSHESTPPPSSDHPPSLPTSQHSFDFLPKVLEQGRGTMNKGSGTIQHPIPHPRMTARWRGQHLTTVRAKRWVQQ